MYIRTVVHRMHTSNPFSPHTPQKIPVTFPPPYIGIIPSTSLIHSSNPPSLNQMSHSRDSARNFSYIKQAYSQKTFLRANCRKRKVIEFSGLDVLRMRGHIALEVLILVQREILSRRCERRIVIPSSYNEGVQDLLDSPVLHE